MTSTEEFMAKWEQEAKERKAIAKAYLLELAPKVIQSGNRYLVACFDGSGDSGQMESIFLSNDDAALDCRYEGDLTGENIPEGFADDLENKVWDLTPDGFENNEGGFGAVILNAEENTVKVNYSYRVEDSCEADYEV